MPESPIQRKNHEQAHRSPRRPCRRLRFHRAFRDGPRAADRGGLSPEDALYGATRACALERGGRLDTARRDGFRRRLRKPYQPPGTRPCHPLSRRHQRDRDPARLWGCGLLVEDGPARRQPFHHPHRGARKSRHTRQQGALGRRPADPLRGRGRYAASGVAGSESRRLSNHIMPAALASMPAALASMPAALASMPAALTPPFPAQRRLRPPCAARPRRRPWRDRARAGCSSGAPSPRSHHARPAG